jgi:hypothetical protein
MRVLCDVCEGTGRENITGETTMKCHNGCEDGTFEATARDFDGMYAYYGAFAGFLHWTRRNDRLTLETEAGFSIMNLKPSDLEITNG